MVFKKCYDCNAFLSQCDNICPECGANVVAVEETADEEEGAATE